MIWLKLDWISKLPQKSKVKSLILNSPLYFEEK